MPFFPGLDFDRDQGQLERDSDQSNVNPGNMGKDCRTRKLLGKRTLGDLPVNH